MHGGGQGFESPQLHFESKAETSQRLPTHKAPICNNTAPNGLRDLLEGFILQLRIEGYSPKTINYYHNNIYDIYDFVAYLGDADISTVTPTGGIILGRLWVDEQVFILLEALTASGYRLIIALLVYMGNPGSKGIGPTS